MSIRVLAALFMLITSGPARSFCGFYVARADAALFNDRSEVILVRDGKRLVVTMSNDFKGDVRDFALVVPVPVLLREQDIRVVERRVFDALDAYSSPRLVEYYDENPCQQWRYADMEVQESVSALHAPTAALKQREEKDSGVTIEARYTVGEYDILILSATESVGLKDWLITNGYRIPPTAHDVLDPYIRSNMKFFVVKVDLTRMQEAGTQLLRPIQLRFESEKFMLPIRLGMANSTGSQDMIVYAFTRTGRVEAVNYRTVKVPSDRNIPLFVKSKFGRFYKDLFARAHRREGRNSVFLEYAWNVTPSFGGMKCDPCVGPPPMPREFAEAGVDWSGAVNGGGTVFFTRMHVRYARDKFPQDLVFQVTPNAEHFQARYILTHPAQGDLTCSEGLDYLETLYHRRTSELSELQALAGWDITTRKDYVEEVRRRLPPERRNAIDGVVMPWKRPGDGGGGTLPWLSLLVGVMALGLWGLRQLRPARSTTAPA